MKKIVFFVIVGGLSLIVIILVAGFFLFGPMRGEVFSSTIELPPPQAGFVLISPDFSDGGPIPSRFTCDGENIPPTLAWGDPPSGTRSLVLIVDDPDAPGGTWTHWIVYNLPAVIRTIDANFRPGMQINEVPVLFGKNSWGKQVYSGPCPPLGMHHYIFHLFAIDIMPGPKDKATITDLSTQMQGHILATAVLTGTYTK